MNHQDRIVRDPAICGGQPVLRGTRVLVRVVLGYLAHGESAETILAEFPTLVPDDIRAVIAFAAAAAAEDLPAPKPTAARDQSGVRLKLDENVPASAAVRLRALGHEVDTVKDEGLVGLPDDQVSRATQAAGRFLVTQDLDLSDVRKFAPGSHHGILLVRLPDAEQWRIADSLVAWFAEPDAPTWSRNVVVATPSKVRVLRPKTLPMKEDLE